MSVIGKDRIDACDRFHSGLGLFYRHNLILNFQAVLIASDPDDCQAARMVGVFVASSMRRAVRRRSGVKGLGRNAVAPADKLSASSLMSCSAVTSNTGMRMRRFSVCMYRIKSIP